MNAKIARILRLASKVLLGGLALGVVGFVVATTGIISVTASSGHWGITAWLLDYVKRRSVATHTIGSTMPPLADPSLVLRGAGQYEGACRPCHGIPDLAPPRVAAAMTPHPPDLKLRAPRYEPEELFYIVKHGIKFTGMPAWPAQERDDEVRAMVAFLLELPKLDAARYRGLVDGDARAAASVIPLADLSQPPRVPPAETAKCARCHGSNGEGRGLGAFPKLAGQSRVYFEGALRAYTQNDRHSGIMAPIAAGLSPEEWAALAAYFAELGPALAGSNEPPDRVARGAAIAKNGDPARGVPSCIDCHGPRKGPRNEAYPSLAGQYAEYLALQLELFANDKRGGSSYANIMAHVAPRLSDEQRRDVASYYASLSANAAEAMRDSE
jgi:cytochrome c553